MILVGDARCRFTSDKQELDNSIVQNSTSEEIAASASRNSSPDQLYFQGQKNSRTLAQNYLLDYFNEDEDFLELNISDASSPDQSDDDISLSSLTPSVQRLFCPTSMSNYSNGTNVTNCAFDKNSSNAHQSTIVQHPAFNGVFDSSSSYGSGSNASSTPSTPNSTSFSNVHHQVTSSALPSFSEIYSPRCRNENHFGLGDSFFKFEEYVSESDTTSEYDLAANIATAMTNSNSIDNSLFQPSSTTVVVKEEPVDSFLPTLSSFNDSMMVQPEIKESLSPLAKQATDNDVNQIKMELDQDNAEYLFCELPKSSQYNLPINWTQQQQHQYQTTFNVTGAPNALSSLDELNQFEEISIASSSSAATFNLGSSLNYLSPIMGQSGDSSVKSSSADNNQNTIPTNKNTIKAKNQRPKSVQSCAVCGDVAACQHYGVMTCEGCKGFFKRTVQKNSKYTCLGNRDCIVDKRRRNRCQFCRFQKCLSVGMVKEVVRTDSLKGRRGRLPSKPKASEPMAPVVPQCITTSLVKAHHETSADNGNIQGRIPSEITNFTLVNEDMEIPLNTQILCLLNSLLNNLKAFMERIPGFTELNENDQKILFQKSSLELFALRLAYQTDPCSNIIRACENSVMPRNLFAVTFGEWLPMIDELGNKLRSMQIDETSFACLCALTVISGRHGIEDLARIENIETRISTALRDHITFTSEAHIKSNYFSKILSNLPELRTIGEQGYRLVMQQIQKIPYGQIPLEVKELETKLNEFNFLPSSSSYGVMDSNSNIQNIESLYNTLPSVSDTIPYLQQTHRL